MKTALIIGTGGCIGKAIECCLSENKFNVIALKRSDCDVTNVVEVKRVIEDLCKTNKIDILINAFGLLPTKAGLEGVVANLENTSVDAIEQMFRVNTLGVFNTISSILPHMISNNEGHIINIGSLRGIKCDIGKGAYSVSKFALRGLSLTFAEELKKYNIKVTLINPGIVNCNVYNRSDWVSRENITQPEDIAKTILSLLRLSFGATIKEINIGEL